MSSIEAGRRRSIDLDASAFVFMAVLGAGCILLFKYFGIAQWILTTVVCSIIVVYAFGMTRIERLHLRLDQAADNAYYLGLVFTLVSMSRALWEVGEAAKSASSANERVAEAIIGDFGVALASTLVGIVCRLLLQQMRLDPADVEKAARLELAQAASIMRAKLATISSEMGEFHEGLRQKHEDYLVELLSGHKKIADKAFEGFQASVDDGANSLKAAFVKVADSAQASADSLEVSGAEVAQAASKFAEAPPKVASALEEASRRIAAVEPPPTEFARRFELLSDSVEGVSNSLLGVHSALSENVEQLRSMLTDFRRAALDVSTAFRVARESEQRRDEVLRVIQDDQLKRSESIEESLNQVAGLLSQVNVGAEDSVRAVSVVEGAAVKALSEMRTVIENLEKRIPGQ